MADVYDMEAERAIRLCNAGRDPHAFLVVEWHAEGYVLRYRDGADTPDARVLAAEMAHILSRLEGADLTDEEAEWLTRLRDRLYRQGEFEGVK